VCFILTYTQTVL